MLTQPLYAHQKGSLESYKNSGRGSPLPLFFYRANFSSGGQISCAAASISREEPSAPPKYFF